MKFEGVYTPLVTPFHKDFTFNKQAMQASIDLLIDAGIDGLIVAGTEGEYYAMSMKERVYLMRVAKEMIAGRVPMIIGTSAIRTEECIEYARQAKVHAADAVLSRRRRWLFQRALKSRRMYWPLSAQPSYPLYCTMTRSDYRLIWMKAVLLKLLHPILHLR